MSLSLGQKLLLRIDKIKQQKRRSFEARICDDLCEELLKHLSLRDRGRLECVSKQFQRTVFLSLNTLKIRDKVFWKLRDFCDEETKTFNFTAFETIVKKCPNIRVILTYSSYFIDNMEEYNWVIFLIVKNCHNLYQMSGWLDLMIDPIRRQFIAKFGLSLRYLRLYSYIGTNVLNKLENLCHLQLKLVDYEMFDVNELHLKRLKKLLIESGIVDDSNNLVVVPTLLNNSQSIECLAIDSSNTDLFVLNSILETISRLNNLVELKFFSPVGLNHQMLDKCLRQIARKCLKLNTIRCSLVIDSSNYSEMDQLLSVFKQFVGLRRLELSIEYNVIVKSNQLFSCKALKGFEKLTHLTLFSGHDLIEDTMFADIDINLPKLQYLKIENRFKATDWTHIILSRLTELKVIRLEITNEDMIPFIRGKLRDNCKKLKTIDI